VAHEYKDYCDAAKAFQAWLKASKIEAADAGLGLGIQ